ncbi:thioredoxin domain-containing protein [Gimesia fumaroli]|uniref:Thioredoxin-like fold domain-containing protein n=1 Tax=Gimesia fumaroli TaxID=2527976 RepID=A0A518ICT7_9PLAN|nr:hypothetical protein [Gimesia fumaroli]QDV50850.1 hypothetical protein Enr17x_28950 [Gimesia fumaroli]
MKTFLVLPALLIAIGVCCLIDSPSNAHNNSDQFKMPVVQASPAAQPARAKKQPTLYILTRQDCAPCKRFEGEVVSRSERAKWLLKNYKVLLIDVAGFPAVMDRGGTQFTWPDGCWNKGSSPLRALTDELGFKKEKQKVGIKDLMQANADLVLSDASGIADDVKVYPESGSPFTVKGDFLEDDAEGLRVDKNAESQPRMAIVDLPRVANGTAFNPENGWRFLINGETWSFNGFQGKDANVQTVLLTISDIKRNTGRVHF